ncbi:MAG: extracellular solute-binding protein [bacterium]|nr:extracellular solute-binding protein [bacterium]MDE0415751.1 extracellular solute-binding protein [bacterium]
MWRQLLGVTGAILLAASLGTPRASAEGEVNFYTWADYTSPELIEKFEAETGITVNIDTFASNEDLLAKMMAGATGYDIVVPGDYLVEILIKEDLLLRVEPNELPNFKNVEPRWVDVYWDPGRHYSIPWMWGTTSFNVNTDVFDGDIHTLAVLFDPPDVLKGRINMFQDSVEVINMALRYLGFPRCNSNPDEMRQVQELLLRQKEWVRSYSMDPKELIVSGEVDATMNWDGYAIRTRAEKPSVAFAHPREGYTGWMDNLAVPRGAENIENAMIFMDFMMVPENIALESNYVGVNGGIMGAAQYFDPELATAPELNAPEGTPDPEFVPACEDDVVRLYDQVWTNVMK